MGFLKITKLQSNIKFLDGFFHNLLVIYVIHLTIVNQ